MTPTEPEKSSQTASTSQASRVDAPAWDDRQLRANPHADGEKARRVRDMFSAIAGSYDLNNRLHSFGLDQRWRHKTVEQAELRPTDHVADIACGTGDLTLAFARALQKLRAKEKLGGLEPGQVRGLDFTPPMLDIARQKSKPSFGEEIIYAVGDATQLDLPDACMDVVSIAFGIRNVSDPAAALAEFHRVLRPGGRLVILEFAEPKNPLVRFGHDLWCKHIMPRTATLIARDQSGAYKYLPRSVETFLDPDAIAQAMRESRFVYVSQRAMTCGTVVVSRGVKAEH